MWRGTTMLVALALVSVHSFDDDYKRTLQITPESEPYVATVSDEDYIRHIHSMYEAYRGAAGGRLEIESKYRTWKRNADLINSLLALPKGMNDAGR